MSRQRFRDFAYHSPRCASNGLLIRPNKTAPKGTPKVIADKLTQALANQTESWFQTLADESRSAAALLQTEAAGGRHQSSVYELFSEMLGKDGHLYSVISTRRNALLGLPREIVAGGPASADASAREFASEAVAAIPDFDGLCRALLEGLAMGFAVVELLWGYNASRRLTIVGWVHHRQESFSFAEDGSLLLLSPPFAAESPSRTEPPLADGVRIVSFPESVRPAPARKFLVLKFGADARSRYGRGLCQHAYWYYWFKKNALKFWAIFNEKFGAPTAIASVPPGTPREERDRLLEVLRALQVDCGAVVPEAIKLQFLEPAKSDGSSFRELADWCNDEMSKIVLGATLTSGEGRRSGSLALGGVHELVRRDYLEADARVLEQVLEGQLLRWLAEVNFPGAAHPRIRLDSRPPEDLREQVEIDKTLLSLGVPIPVGYFHERYGRPAPTSREERLRYDDANLFGYHLQFGILTINEARQRLGLPPVAWGDRRAAALATADPKGAADGTPVDTENESGVEDEPGKERRNESEEKGR